MKIILQQKHKLVESANGIKSNGLRVGNELNKKKNILNPTNISDIDVITKTFHNAMNVIDDRDIRLVEIEVASDFQQDERCYWIQYNESNPMGCNDSDITKISEIMINVDLDINAVSECSIQTEWISDNNRSSGGYDINENRAKPITLQSLSSYFNSLNNNLDRLVTNSDKEYMEEVGE